MYIPDYDYKVVDVKCYVDASYLDQAIIDNAGGGWELVTVLEPSEGGSSFFLVFKRPY